MAKLTFPDDLWNGRNTSILTASGEPVDDDTVPVASAESDVQNEADPCIWPFLSSSGHTPSVVITHSLSVCQARDAGLDIEALGERIMARKEQLKQQFAGGKLPPSHTRSFSGPQGWWRIIRSRRLATTDHRAAVVASALAAGNYPEPSALLANNGPKESASAP
jgi:hypothetical protein